MVAVNRRTAIQIGNQVLNEVFGQSETAIIKLRTIEGLWNEDWYIASGHYTNIAINVSNVNNDTIVVIASICFNQAIW